MFKAIFVLATILMSHTSFAARIVNVTGRGQYNTYCSTPSAQMCLNNAKNTAIRESERDARWACEMRERGHSRTFTMSTYANCNPSYIPPNSNNTWVSCRSETRMQCEVE